MLIIDTIETVYRELFTVTLSQPAFQMEYTYTDPVTHLEKTIVSSSLFEKLSIEPDPNTKKLFANHSMNFRCRNDRLICVARTGSQKLYTPMETPMRIRFMMYAQPSFIERTDVIAAGSTLVYQFTNAGRTGTPANRYLTENAAGVSASDLKPVASVEAEERCFGVIDILTNVTDPAYRLFNMDALEGPAFTIVFNAL